jgi:hypothetical protein
MSLQNNSMKEDGLLTIYLYRLTQVRGSFLSTDFIS